MDAVPACSGVQYVFIPSGGMKGGQSQKADSAPTLLFLIFPQMRGLERP